MDAAPKGNESMEPLDRQIAEALRDSGAATPAPAAPPALLLVGDSHHDLDELDRSGVFASPDFRARRAGSIDQAIALLAGEPFDVVLLDAAWPEARARELAETLRRGSPSARLIVCSARASFAAAVMALRLGAMDFFKLPADAGEVRARVAAAAAAARADRQREDRVSRLKSVCAKLNTARHEIGQQVDGLCEDLVNAYEEMADRISEVSMASEFRTLLKQELDLEDLLRTALQYLLTKTGPTNAAVFLPGVEGGFTLGAYVNYDCPRQSIAVLLEHLGQAICPQMKDENRVVRFDDAAEFAQAVGVEAGVLAESQVVAFTCSDQERCMAVIVLFRCRLEPFGEELPATIDVLRPIFAQQVASVIRIHHRAAPSWPREAVEDDHDFNDEADYGFGQAA